MSDDSQQQDDGSASIKPEALYLIPGKELLEISSLINRLSALQGVSWGDVNPALQALGKASKSPAPVPTTEPEAKANGRARS